MTLSKFFTLRRWLTADIFEIARVRRLRRELEVKLFEAATVGAFAAIASLIATLLDHKDIGVLLFSKSSLYFISGIVAGMLFTATFFFLARWYYRRKENIQRTKRFLTTTYLTALRMSPVNPMRKQALLK